MPAPTGDVLTCRTIGDLADGQAEIIINDAIREIIRDVDSRGHDEKPRELKILLTFTKKDNLLVVDCQAGNKVPAYRTSLTNAKIRVAQNGTRMLLFQKYNAENPDQETLGFDEHGNERT